MDVNDISPELKEKAKACKTPEDILALAKEAGYELSDEELEGISGGGWGSCGRNTCETRRKHCTGNIS